MKFFINISRHTVDKAMFFKLIFKTQVLVFLYFSPKHWMLLHNTPAMVVSGDYPQVFSRILKSLIFAQTLKMWNSCLRICSTKKYFPDLLASFVHQLHILRLWHDSYRKWIEYTEIRKQKTTVRNLDVLVNTPWHCVSSPLKKTDKTNGFFPFQNEWSIG